MVDGAAAQPGFDSPSGDPEPRHVAAAEAGNLPGLAWWDTFELQGALREPVPTWTAVPDSLAVAVGELLGAALKAVAADPAREAAWARMLLLPRVLFAIPPAGDDQHADWPPAPKVIGARIPQAWAGDWAGLWAATARPGDNGGGGSRRPPDAATHTKRVHELIMLGEVSRAAAAASGPGKLAVGAEARARVASLFPGAGAPRVPPPPQCPSEAWEADDAEEAARHLNKFPRSSGPGLTGARFEHWATLRGNADGKEALVQVLAVILRGDAPPAASKAQNSAVLSLDVANAFNELDRDVVLREVAQRLPSLARLALARYGGDTTHGANAAETTAEVATRRVHISIVEAKDPVKMKYKIVLSPERAPPGPAHSLVVSSDIEDEQPEEFGKRSAPRRQRGMPMPSRAPSVGASSLPETPEAMVSAAVTDEGAFMQQTPAVSGHTSASNVVDMP
ncbi:unnamed protein product [Prorocentrum cordatum]|uniref:Reverse transcriptase domain-containing protein n=1 Tax=Prorocentrum cordatum TaxID=2364126 RepID=A0ABN9V3K5_9DINO|nr:unnamed protein product [Polarella glacialis]